MSEFIAEAQVLVVPNVSGFAATLRKQVTAAVAAAGPIVIPIAAGPVAGGLKQIEANTLAQRDLAASTKVASKVTEEQAGALAGQKAAAKAAALEAKRLADAQLLQARRTGQASRAIEAQAASLVGVRGAVLTASTPFLLATAAVITFSKSIKEASSETEELNKTAVVFGSSAKQIEEFSKTTAKSLGISSTEALKSAGIFGNLFRTLKIGERVSADMSEQLVKLSSDLASFNNADPSRVLEALRSGLVGQARPLRVFGIFISQARAQQEALIETGKKNIKSLTNQELVQARYNIILADSGLAQGDFARTSDRLANQSRILKAEISDLGVSFGRVLIPAVTLTVQGINDFIGDVNDTIGVVTQLTGDIGALAAEIKKSSPAQFIIEIITKIPGGGGIGDAFKKIKAELEIAAGAAAFTTGAAFSELGIGIPVAAAGIILLDKGLHDFNAEAKQLGTDAKKSVHDLFEEFKKAGQGPEAFKTLIAGLTELEAKLSSGDAFSKAFARGILRLLVQLQALGSNAKVEDIGKAIADAIARGFNTRAFVIGDAIKKSLTLTESQITGQLQKQVTAVARAQAFGGTGLTELGTELQRIDKILASKKAPIGPALERLLNERKSVIGQIKSINEGAAADALERATKAAKRQSDAIQAFIETFAPKRQRLQNRLSQADQSGTAKTLIAINKLIIANDKKEIEAIKDRIRHLKLHGDALKLARAAINTLQQEIFKTRLDIEKDRKTQQDAAKQAAQDRLDARQAHLEALLSIAEANKGTADDRKALNAIIAFDEARIAALKKKRHKTREEKAQLDAYRVDLAQRRKALRDLTDETKKGSSAFFEFLQTQQGFAANLLGNLIPGFATGGLVGGSPGASGSAGAAAFPGALLPQEHGFGPESGVAASAALSSSRERGVRPVQVDTTNHLLRQILRSLQNLNGRASAPEARYQKSVASGGMDTVS